MLLFTYKYALNAKKKSSREIQANKKAIAFSKKMEYLLQCKHFILLNQKQTGILQHFDIKLSFPIITELNQF